MPQKTKGARPVLDRLYGTLDAMTEDATIAHKQAIYNSPFAKQKLGDILDSIAELKDIIRHQVEPFMERAAPQTEQRIAELEQRLAAIERATIPHRDGARIERD
jgi:cell division septum initiation protein DivIVA